MKASERVLAWRYARALFLAAAERGEEARVQADLQGAHREILDCLPVLSHPRVSAGEKKRKLKEALSGRVSSLSLRFLELLVDKKRFELLPQVEANVARLLSEKNNLAKAAVRSARPLSSQEQERLRQALQRFSGKKIELEIKEDPEIIGGLVVRLGDWVMDSSLRGQLGGLREAIDGNQT